jgi:hypothetical protein
MSASAKHISEFDHSNVRDDAPIVFFDLWATLIDEKPGSPFYAAIANQMNVDLQKFVEAYRA